MFKKYSFLKENKFFTSFLIAIFIIGGTIYFSLQEKIESKNINCQCPNSENVLVTKVIDGDTIVVQGGYHIRLLGIDADEKGYPCYEKAKKRLEELILNKIVRLEKDIENCDKYGRCLNYVFLNQKNINLEMIKEGLAIARFYPPNLKYEKSFQEAEKEAILNKRGCKWKK